MREVRYRFARSAIRDREVIIPCARDKYKTAIEVIYKIASQPLAASRGTVVSGGTDSRVSASRGLL